MSCNILLLAAGRIKREDASADYPNCMAEIDGTLIIEHVIDTTRQIPEAEYYCSILQRDSSRFHLDDVVRQLISSVKIVTVPEDTKGSACTALLAAVTMNRDASLLVVSSNEWVKVDLMTVVNYFLDRSFDAGTITFRSLHPRYSYVKLDEKGFVIEVAQHRPISSHATAGVFWYARTQDFVDAAMALIRKDATDDGYYYVAPTFNELILKQRKVGTYPIQKSAYVPLKNAHQIKQYQGIRL